MVFKKGCKIFDVFSSLFSKRLTLILITLLPMFVMAQDQGNENLELLVLGILIVTIVIVLFVVFVIANKLVGVSQQTVRQSTGEETTASLIPSFKDLTAKSVKFDYVGDEHYVKLKKGFDIMINGRAVKQVTPYHSSTYAIKPTDFISMLPIPKMQVEEGDEVKAGDPLFYDKTNPDVIYTAPVSGEIAEIKRAEKRSIAEVIILADKEIKYKNFNIGDRKMLSREAVIALMLESGTWPTLRQRPYNVVADPEDEPKGIFISAFDSSPLAANYNFTLQNEGEAFQAGIDVLNILAPEAVHLSMNAAQKPATVFLNATGVSRHWFEGAHPAGNVGVQIHHISPIGRGEIAWHMSPQDVVILGRLFLTGKYDTRKIIAIAGSEVETPQYVQTNNGANIEKLLSEHVVNEHVRYISGNVLTGKKVEKNGHLGYFDNLISVITEGDFYEFFGWILPSYARPSISPTFPLSKFRDEEFDVNTNTHGEERAFVVTGQYEEVLPMDIYPVHLLKAILANDFEQMEGLGIYEVVEEDLALCEFVCTSKIDVQEILREGLDYIREQN